jgi:hypothetical protein
MKKPPCILRSWQITGITEVSITDDINKTSLQIVMRTTQHMQIVEERRFTITNLWSSLGGGSLCINQTSTS